MRDSTVLDFLAVMELVDMPLRPLGFDTEWRFFWSKGTTVARTTATVQIGDDKIILLVQLSAMTRKSTALCFDQVQWTVVYLARMI